MLETAAFNRDDGFMEAFEKLVEMDYCLVSILATTSAAVHATSPRKGIRALARALMTSTATARPR